MIQRADIDKDNLVSEEEFYLIMTSKEYKIHEWWVIVYIPVWLILLWEVERIEMYASGDIKEINIHL